MGKKQFIVIGIGRFGHSIATTLASLGEEVLAVDSDEHRIAEIMPYVTHAIQADATEENTMQALGIGNFDVAVVSIGSNLQASIIITLLCKQLGVNFVVAKALTDMHAKLLYKMGADKVIMPERDMGTRVAHNLSTSDVLDDMDLAGDLRIVEVPVIDAWAGKSLIELDFRARYDLIIIAIKRQGTKATEMPKGTDIIEHNDSLIVVGDKKAIKKLETVVKK